MSDELVKAVRDENYVLKVFEITKDSVMSRLTIKLAKFMQEVYRFIEPSHFPGRIMVFFKKDDTKVLPNEKFEKLYDLSMLSKGNFKSILIQLFQDEEELPIIYINLDDKKIDNVKTVTDYVVYEFINGKELFNTNQTDIKVPNRYTCPSIFALQYHFLNESLLRYKTERIRKVSCEHFKNCWSDKKYLYYVNEPEDPIQLSVSEYLKNSLRGVDIVREYNLGASKPVDIRVFWSEANRAALIEIKLMGRAVDKNRKPNDYEYTNKRANDGMDQIKEYIELAESDSPKVINKGYLVVVDGRRKGLSKSPVKISLADGLHYENIELEIDKGKQFYENHLNIEEPIRMFAEPICD